MQPLTHQITAISVPQDVSFMNGEAAAFFGRCEKVLTALELESSSYGLVFVQNIPITPFHQTHVSFVCDQAFVDELVHCYEQLESLLNRIRMTAVPTVFLSSGDCLGETFELALACRVRLFAESASWVGFPELDGGISPIFLVEQKAAAYPPPWRYTAVVPMIKAVTHHIVTSLIPNDLFLMAVAAPDTIPMPLSRPDSMPMRRQLNPLVLRQLAERRLGSKFTAWLARRTVEANSSSGFLSPHQPKLLLWNISGAMPDPTITAKAVARGCKITFSSRRPLDFPKDLAKIYADLVELLGENDANAAWAAQIFWITTQTPDTAKNSMGSNLIGSTEMDPMAVDSRSIIWKSPWSATIGETGDIHFSAIGAKSDRVLCEFFARSGANQNIDEAVKQMSWMTGGVIQTQFQNGMPPSMWLRLEFFGEMTRLASHRTGNLDEIAAALKKYDWAFACSITNWQMVLNFYQIIANSRASSILSGIPQSWHEATMLARRNRPKTLWNHAQIVSHLLIYLGQLVERYCSTYEGQDRQTLDYIAAQALGVPDTIHSPLIALASVGPRAAQYHFEQADQYLGQEVGPEH